MNKKGFTLVEMLAVIAILAILVVILVPNFVDMFQQSKTNVFVTEIQTLMKQAQQEWMLDGGGAKTYKTGDFSLDGNSSSFKYSFAMNNAGLFTKVAVSDGTNCYSKTNTSGIKMSDILDTDVKHVSNSDFSTCTATIP